MIASTHLRAVSGQSDVLPALTQGRVERSRSGRHGGGGRVFRRVGAGGEGGLQEIGKDGKVGQLECGVSECSEEDGSVGD